MPLLSKFKVILFLLIPLYIQANFEPELQAIQEGKLSIQKELETILEHHPLQGKGRKDVKLILAGEHTYFITQHLARYLLSVDSFGRENRKDSEHRGHHPTVHLGNLFFKADVSPPLDPLMELAVFYLQTLLFKKGVAPSNFIFMEGVERKVFPCTQRIEMEQVYCVIDGKEELYLQRNTMIPCLSLKENHVMQVSLAISGLNFKNVLASIEEHKQDFNCIDSQSFGEHILVGLLIRPSDHKPENFILSTNGQLICIDNDCTFCHTDVIKDEQATDFYQCTPQPFAGIKNILLLLKPLLDHAVDSKVQERICRLNVDELIRTWDLLLQQDEAACNVLFSKNDELRRRSLRNYIPLCLSENILSKLSSQLLEFQKLFQQQESPITYSQLWKYAYPDSFDYYGYMLAFYSSYTKTLGKIYSNERPFKCLKSSEEKLDPSVLKGRWLFNKLVDEKRRRKKYPLIKPPYAHIKDLLLRNSDNNILRQRIIDLCLKNEFPSLQEYPYNWVLSYGQWLRKQDDFYTEFEPVFNAFLCSQKTYEAIIDNLFDNQSLSQLEQEILNATDEFFRVLQ